MKKLLAIICAVALMISAAACTTKTDYSGQTLTGQVESIDENGNVTVTLGEWIEEEFGNKENGEQPPEMPDGEQPPEMPDGEMPEMPDGEPPELPDGQSPSDRQPDGEPPEKPDGSSSDSNKGFNGKGNFGGRSFGTFTASDEKVTFDFSEAIVSVQQGPEVKEGTIDDITEGCIVTFDVGDNGKVDEATVVSSGESGNDKGNKGGFDPSGGNSGEVTQGTAVVTISEDETVSNVNYTSSGDDENAVRVEGATATLSNVTIEKTGGESSNTESGDFYGVNAGLLATDGATVTIKNSTVNTSAKNGNGVFSYGEGTTVNISDTEITTTGDNSGGIQTTGGGTTNATNLTVNTSGNSSAAIRSDRGGGTVNVDKGSYTSNGYNSPAVYSTADITVKNASLTANNSEALVIEGKNSIILENCDVSGNMSATKSSSGSENVHNIMIYQSMSGDAEVGTSSLSITGGKVVSNSGDMIYVTNTNCKIYLSGVAFTNNDATAYLLRVSGNSSTNGWGTAGKNGGSAEVTADAQTLEGNIIVDSISTLNLTLKNGSSLKGTINIVDNAQNGTAVDNNAVVTIEKGCTWTLTGDCTITSLTNNGTINFNGYTITLADGTVLK